jgi:hypothetical protein
VKTIVKKYQYVEPHKIIFLEGYFYSNVLQNGNISLGYFYFSFLCNENKRNFAEDVTNNEIKCKNEKIPVRSQWLYYFQSKDNAKNKISEQT